MGKNLSPFCGTCSPTSAADQRRKQRVWREHHYCPEVEEWRVKRKARKINEGGDLRTDGQKSVPTLRDLFP